jgi:hypothetical protein
MFSPVSRKARSERTNRVVKMLTTSDPVLRFELRFSEAIGSEDLFGAAQG